MSVEKTGKAQAHKVAPPKKSRTMLEWESTLRDMKNAGLTIRYWVKDSISYKAYVKGFPDDVIPALNKHSGRMGFQVFILELPDYGTGMRSMIVQHYKGLPNCVKIYPEQVQY
jgi:hypothetical protein